MVAAVSAQIYFMVISRRVISRIRSPQQGQTFCILTVCILRSLQLLLFMSIIVGLFRIAFIGMFDKFSELVLKNDMVYHIYYLYLLSSNFQHFCTDLLYFMQIVEWSLIIFVINSQRKLAESEITHLHVRDSRFNKFKVSLGLSGGSG